MSEQAPDFGGMGGFGGVWETRLMGNLLHYQTNYFAVASTIGGAVAAARPRELACALLIVVSDNLMLLDLFRIFSAFVTGSSNAHAFSLEMLVGLESLRLLSMRFPLCRCRIMCRLNWCCGAGAILCYA